MTFLQNRYRRYALSDRECEYGYHDKDYKTGVAREGVANFYLLSGHYQKSSIKNKGVGI